MNVSFLQSKTLRNFAPLNKQSIAVITSLAVDDLIHPLKFRKAQLFKCNPEEPPSTRKLNAPVFMVQFSIHTLLSFNLNKPIIFENGVAFTTLNSRFLKITADLFLI